MDKNDPEKNKKEQLLGPCASTDEASRGSVTAASTALTEESEALEQTVERRLPPAPVSSGGAGTRLSA